MEIFKYYALCWKLDQGLVCGHLLGTQYEVVSKSAKKITTMLSSQLARDLEKNPFDAEPRIHDAKLKILHVEVRPGYKEKDGMYPTTSTMKISIAAVYGKNNQGFYECFMPFLNESFFFYNLDQVNSLVEHFSKNIFQRLTPEQLHRYIMPSKPWLQDFTVRSKEKNFVVHFSPEKEAPVLSRIAERFPRSKNAQRNMRIFPEAAWEQTDTVQLIVEKIVKEQANILLVGDRGVGKSVILQEVIRKVFQIQRENNPYEKRRTYFWRTSPNRITSGAKFLGEWEDICEDMLDDLQRIRGILWLINFMEMFTVGGQGAEDSIAAYISSYLRDGRIQIVAELTPHELDRCYTLLPEFIQYFQIVRIEEMPRNKIFKILHNFQNHALDKLNVDVEQRALEITYRLLKRFVKYESFPGKIATFLSECFNNIFLRGKNNVYENDIIETFIEKTGMPRLFLDDHLPLDREQLRDFFSSRIIGQQQAVDKICTVIKVFKSGLNDPQKPIATMMFAGPTGVGKTASVRALAEYFFGHGQKKHPLIRLDMSEFQHPAQISRLIGEGNEIGKLTREIRERPFSVVLFDEIEKAHPAIFDTLLTVLDEGILVDNFGRVSDFRNAIIIMTSNLGAKSSTTMGFNPQESREYESSIRKFFRPEFFNRLDMVVVFNPLDKDNIKKIIHKELSEISMRDGVKNNNLHLSFTNTVIDLLLDKGFDELYGARPLQRAIEKLVVAELAKYIMHNNPQNTQLNIDYQQKIIIEEKHGKLK
ncbi:AAA family ATPase [Candidatus Uabimicrobium amorphum]|uniref:ATPase AAA n=1 Tax=Uabimicrobium amorphum TaxID=2596890 RepID=A0A5S9ITV5_UABAM|nr:AAA family ATPase [Candidatus Uabimicrobium amorphum]BBM87311.1 ATPase AAA [Candidatus Uabimicrobium amorphum]